MKDEHIPPPETGDQSEADANLPPNPAVFLLRRLRWYAQRDARRKRRAED